MNFVTKGVFLVLFVGTANAKNYGYGYDKDSSVREKRFARSPLCLDRFAAVPGHTMCIGLQHKHPMNDSIRNDIVDHHNQIRESVTPASANMPELSYLKSLEVEAQLWAETCAMDHDDTYRRFQPDRFFIGQNLAGIKSTQINWTEAIETWEAEKSKFTFGVTNDTAIVGNYIQMIWAETTAIGCGVAKCQDSHFYVCNYAPLMDLTNLSHPYVRSASGKSCDLCPGKCDPKRSNKMCNCAGLVCFNGATVNFTTCRCDCIKGDVTYNETNYCQLNCDKRQESAQCGKGAFTKQSCRTRPDTVFNCPWMCEMCPYSDQNYMEGQASKLPWEKELPDYCTMDDHCVVAKNAGCSSHSCECKSAFKGTVNDCQPRVLGDACTTPADCINVANATCDTAVCACPNHWRNDTAGCVPIGFGDACQGNDDCVAVPDAICDASKTCKCPANRTYDTVGHQCVPKGLGDACADSSECAAVSNATCDTVCKCPANWTIHGNACIPKVIGSPCISNNTCVPAHALCLSKMCSCPDGFNNRADVCTAIIRSGNSAASLVTSLTLIVSTVMLNYFWRI